MSFGMFEAAVAGDKENEHQKKLAKTRLAQAAAEVDQKLGSFLAKATSKSDYIERVRLAENDFREIVSKYLEGDTGFKAVATKMADHYVQAKVRRSSAKNLHMLDDMQVLDGYATVASGLEEGWGADEGMTQEDLQDYEEELERRGIDPYNNDVYSSRRRTARMGLTQALGAFGDFLDSKNLDANSPHIMDDITEALKEFAGQHEGELDRSTIEALRDTYIFKGASRRRALRRQARDRSFNNQTDQFQSWFYQNYPAEDFDDYDEESKEGFVQEYIGTKTARRKKSRAASRRKEATPWEEGSEPQFTETGWGEYVMESGDYSAAVQEDGSWAVVHNGRVVGEGEGNGDPDDSFGEVEQWFKKNASRKEATGRLDKLKKTNPQEYNDFMETISPGVVFEPGELDILYQQWFKKNASRKKGAGRVKKAEDDWSEYDDALILGTAEQLAKVDPNSDLWPKLYRELVSRGLLDQVSFLSSRKRSAGSGYDVYNHPDVGELHVTFYNDGTAVVTSPEVGEVGSIRVMPDDGPEDIEEQLNILVDEVRYASKKTAGEYLSPGDLEDHGAQIFFNQYADSHGIDTYGEDYDRMWNDIKEHVEYDVISADLDTAVEHGELSSAVGSRLQWDLEDFYGFGTGALFSSKRSRRQKQAEWGKERFPGTNEMFERAGWQSTDPEKSEWLSPSGYAMYDGSTGSAYYFDPDDNVSSFYTLEDEEFSDNLPQVLTDDEEYQSRLWEY